VPSEPCNYRLGQLSQTCLFKEDFLQTGQDTLAEHLELGTQKAQQLRIQKDCISSVYDNWQQKMAVLWQVFQRENNLAKDVCPFQNQTP
jgi:hypothetical protein